QVRQGVALLEKWLAEHPQEQLASGMWQYLGDTWFYPLNDPARAVACYDRCVELGWTDQGNHGPLLSRGGVRSERIGNAASAVGYYARVIVETPTSGKAYESQLALQRLDAPVPEITLFSQGATTRPAGAPATQE